MSVLSSLLKQLGLEESERFVRQFATAAFKTGSGRRQELLASALRDAPLGNLDAETTRRAWRRILDSFDSVAQRNPDLLAGLPDIPLTKPAPSAAFQAEAAPFVEATQTGLEGPALRAAGPGLTVPPQSARPGVPPITPPRQLALPEGAGRSLDPLSLLMDQVDNDLVRGTQVGLHPILRSRIQSIRRGLSPNLPPQTPYRPPPTTSPAEPLSRKREDLHQRLTTLLNDRAAADPALVERFPALAGGRGDLGQRISTMFDDISRVLTDPLPPGPSDDTPKRVQALALEVGEKLGIRTEKAKNKLVRRAGGLKSTTVPIAEVSTPRVIALTEKIERTNARIAELESLGDDISLRRAKSFTTRVAQLEKEREQLVKLAVTEFGIDARIRFTEALIDFTAEPLAAKDRDFVRRLTQFTLRQQGDITTSAPDFDLPTALGVLLNRAGFKQPSGARTQAARQLLARGVRTPTELPATEFRTILTGSGAVSVRKAPAAALKNAPAVGSIVRTTGERTFQRARTPIAGNVEIPPILRDADLIVVDVVEARVATGRVATATEQDAAQLLAQAEAAEAAKRPRKEVRALFARAFAAKTQLQRAARGKATGQTERIAPAAVVVSLDNPVQPFVIEFGQLKALRPPSTHSTRFADDARAVIADQQSAEQLFNRAAAKAGVSILSAGTDRPTAFVVRRNGSMFAEYVIDPGRAAEIATEPGISIEAVVGDTPLQAAQRAFDRAVDQNKIAILSTMTKSLDAEIKSQRANVLSLDELLATTQQPSALREKAIKLTLESHAANLTEAADRIVSQLAEDAIPARMSILLPREFAGRFREKPFGAFTIGDLDIIMQNNVRRIARQYRLRPETIDFRIQDYGTAEIPFADFQAVAKTKERITQLVEKAGAPVFTITGENFEGQTRMVVLDLTAGGKIGVLNDPQMEAVQAAYDKLEESAGRVVKGLCATEEL